MRSIVVSGLFLLELAVASAVTSSGKLENESVAWSWRVLDGKLQPVLLEDKIMNKYIATATGIILLAAPFAAQAASINLNDAYHYDNSAYDIQMSESPYRNIEVTISDVYRSDDTGAFSLLHESRKEVAEFAVFRESSRLDNNPGVTLHDMYRYDDTDAFSHASRR